MDKNLSDLLSAYPELQCIPSNKIRCSLTGHEMPSNYDAVQHFVQGSKFQRMKRLQEQLRKNEAYFEDRGSHLFCKLTKRSVAKDGAEIERHINGRRFRSALKKASTADENGNQMETGEDMESPAEPRLIDASDTDDDEDPYYNMDNDDDSISSSSSARDVEAVDNGELYPELAYSDNGGGGDSDYDFNAMDTDLDAETSTKRKVDNHSSDTPANKRRRF